MAKKVGDGVVSLYSEFSGCMAFFDGLDVNRKTIQKRILSSVATGGKQAIRRNYSRFLRKRTGNLYRSIKSYVKRNGSAVVFTNDADSGKNTGKGGKRGRYGFMLASGFTVTNKGKYLLTFNCNGQWIRKYSVTVRERDWVEGPIERYTESTDCHNRMDSAFQKQVDYWDKRLGGIR